jgi:hypothetical protein
MDFAEVAAYMMNIGKPTTFTLFIKVAADAQLIIFKLYVGIATKKKL